MQINLSDQNISSWLTILQIFDKSQSRRPYKPERPQRLSYQIKPYPSHSLRPLPSFNQVKKYRNVFLMTWRKFLSVFSILWQQKMCINIKSWNELIRCNSSSDQETYQVCKQRLLCLVPCLLFNYWNSNKRIFLHILGWNTLFF